MEHTMIRRYTIAIAFSVLSAFGMSDNASVAAGRAPQAPPSSIPLPGRGESRTPLPDGRWVVFGGQGANGPVSTVSIVDPSMNTTVVLPARLHEARAWHTATILPDGAILIVGGRGSDGRALASAERFDASTETVSSVEMPAAHARRASSGASRPEGSRASSAPTRAWLIRRPCSGMAVC